MGQFKPMVKMMTTEPSIELKLKKGGAVSHPKKMMNGGVMSGLAAAPTPGARGGMAPAMRPKKPSMAARRAAMMGMKEGGDTALQKHAAMPASKAHKGLKTGGVVMGQGGFKEGGAVPKSGILPVSESERGAKGYVKTKMVTAQGEHHTPKKTGEVKMGNAGGYKKGGKAKKMAYGGEAGDKPTTSKPEGVSGSSAGYMGSSDYTGATDENPYSPVPERKLPNRRGPIEYAKGGKACYAKGGGVEGNVSTSKPGVTNTTTGEVKKGNAGGYMKGGAAKKAFAAGGSVNDSGRPVAYPAKPVSKSVKNNLQSGTFKHGGKVKMAEGGKIPAEAQSAIKQADAERAFRDYEKAETAENKAMRDAILGAPKRMFEAAKGLFKGKEAPSGSVTKTEKSVTVTPAKKRGGSVKC